jgi:uncharacterized radical SAM superfamily protein
VRVLLLNPPGREIYVRDYFCSKTTKSNYHFHPVDLLALSGTLAEEHSVSVLDCIAERLSPLEAKRRIDLVDPEAIVSLVGSVSWEEDRVFLADQARAGRRVFGIGDILHENQLDRLREEPWLEGILDDFTTRDVIHLLAGTTADVLRASWRQADGALCHRDESRSGREHRLPRPRHELFPSHGYRFSFARLTPFATVLTDYGCPWPCTFCVISTLGHSARPVEDVLEEIDALRAAGTHELFVADQTFGVRRERALQLCEEFKARGDLSWTAFTRPDLADDELLGAMRSAGCHTLIMGVESADDAVLEACKKGYATEVVRGAFQRASEHGLRTVGTFVVGLPEETQDSLEQTLDLALELDLDFMSLNVAVPRFGTAFRADAIAAGLVDPEELVMDQSGATIALQTRALDRQEVDRMKRHMIRRFYLRPSWLWRRLRDVSGPRELFAQAREGVALLSRNT